MSATLRIEDFTENRRLFKVPPPVITVRNYLSFVIFVFILGLKIVMLTFSNRVYLFNVNIFANDYSHFKFKYSVVQKLWKEDIF